MAERLVIPLHPPVIKLTPAQLDAFVGEYTDKRDHPTATIFRQGDQLYRKNSSGEIEEIAPESPTVFFYPNGPTFTRLTFEHDALGHVNGLVLHDDRHEERWERHALPGTK